MSDPTQHSCGTHNQEPALAEVLTAFVCHDVTAHRCLELLLQNERPTKRASLPLGGKGTHTMEIATPVKFLHKVSFSFNNLIPFKSLIWLGWGSKTAEPELS